MSHADLTHEIFEDLPHYYENDPVTSMVIDALAAELERLEETAEAIRNQFFAPNADDTYGLLAVHERGLGISVMPGTITLSGRQNAVRAAVGRRFSPKGSDWTAAVTLAIGTSDWTVAANYPNDSELTINVPFDVGTDEFNSVEPLIRPFTPAALDIVVTSGQGFVVGVSAVGEEVI